MTTFASLWGSPLVREGCAELTRAVEVTTEEAITIQQIPAPTFTEEARAQYVYVRFQELGLAEVEMDASGNVYGFVPGREAGEGLLVSAHLDTVFEADTDLTIRHTGDRIYGPGIGDNSLGVAGLLTLADLIQEQHPRRDLWFVANVGEEGLGNLKGMWAAMRRLEPRVGAVIVLEGGAYGGVIHRGVGVQRRRLTVETPGGHAWSDFGSPSAIHELCRIGAAIAALDLPESPRTTFNLGTIEGGTSINTIAATATALLDLRSEEPASLDDLARRVNGILSEVQRDGVMVQSEQIGERPAGSIPASHPLVRAATESLLWLGYDDPVLRAASTDANVPLSMGVPAVCIGLAVGHNAHRLDEYIELDLLGEGLQHAYLVIWTTAEMLL
ncbi:MAG: M20/M25/M40 family metallo-hydrolase [Chloroflexota bacterium]|nr:M20/M25/M40 family metallo-hydrolase [Chloroflexota bacterium]